MIIDVHGHYTTAPPQLQAFRDAQLAALAGDVPAPALEAVTDDEIRASIENNQLRVLRERGGDVMLFSPKASGMEHHITDPATATAWARASNDLIARAGDLFPERLVPVAQLPQTPTSGIEAAAAELRRCVEQLGFVGCNVNPDPSGGFWTAPPLTDEYWFPLYETMAELDVPAMIHVSSSCNPTAPTLSAHYLNADTNAVAQLLEGDLFARYPQLRLIIPHGGGAIPYHWGRYRGLARRNGRPDPADQLFGNVFFDTCVYHQPGIDLLFDVIPAANLLFASEMLGAVRGADPATGIEWDDTLQYVRRLSLPADTEQQILEGNARRVFPRLAARIPVVR